jgi:hypothetical protein
VLRSLTSRVAEVVHVFAASFCGRVRSIPFYLATSMQEAAAGQAEAESGICWAGLGGEYQVAEAGRPGDGVRCCFIGQLAQAFGDRRDLCVVAEPDAQQCGQDPGCAFPAAFLAAFLSAFLSTFLPALLQALLQGFLAPALVDCLADFGAVVEVGDAFDGHAGLLDDLVDCRAVEADCRQDCCCFEVGGLLVCGQGLDLPDGGEEGLCLGVLVAFAEDGEPGEAGAGEEFCWVVLGEVDRWCVGRG